jgi:hypothetical protein
MLKLQGFAPGGYDFVVGGFPYSAGVRAQAGHALRRVRFSRVLPMNEGFDWIETHLKSQGLPLHRLAACELRSPAALSLQGFQSFNQGYVKVLTQWGLIRDGLNPVARSNLAPQHDAPPGPGFHAFTYSVPEAGSRDWVVAGSGEWPEDQPFPQGIVARGDTSESGLRRKVAYVLDTMLARMQALRVTPQDVSVVQVYTVHDVAPYIDDEFQKRRLLAPGLTWHLCRPPIQELEFEMDVRGVRQELWAPV